MPDDKTEARNDGPSCEDVLREGEVAFTTFILSLGTSVLVHLGMVENEATGRRDVNLPMARHVIDTLAMLKEKTRGNLADDEQKLIDSLLFDLRLKFVEACRKNDEESKPKEGS